MNKQAKYLGGRSLWSKLIVQAQSTECSSPSDKNWRHSLIVLSPATPQITKSARSVFAMVLL